MIAKKHRVNRSKIDFIMKKGEALSTSFFLVKFKKNNEQLSRCSVIISKKVAKEAVIRNLYRRRVYEGIRHNFIATESTSLNHYDLVFIAKKHLVPSCYQVIASDIKNIKLTSPNA